jgi:putative ABC transport system ATP-binding protein
VDLTIEGNEFVSIAGPSGCGKSTLLSILGLLDSCTEGTYLLNVPPVHRLGQREGARIRNREIGFIFQAFRLIGDLTASENVELPLTYRGMSSAERKRRVQEALDRVGLGARALVGGPAILLADEPTGNLDSKSGEAVIELLKELHRAVHLFDGKIVEECVAD